MCTLTTGATSDLVDAFPFILLDQVRTQCGHVGPAFRSSPQPLYAFDDSLHPSPCVPCERCACPPPRHPQPTGLDRVWSLHVWCGALCHCLELQVREEASIHHLHTQCSLVGWLLIRSALGGVPVCVKECHDAMQGCHKGMF